MMKTLVVVGHPDLNKSVVNKAWVEGLRLNKKDNVDLRILSDHVNSDGSFDISQEQSVLEQYDRIVLQFPLYWYMVPDIMKKWMDSVWAEGWCYGPGGMQLEGKLLEVSVSCGAPKFVFEGEGNVSLEQYLLFLKGTAGFVRAKAGRIFACYDAEGTGAQEENLRHNVEQYVDFINDTKTIE